MPSCVVVRRGVVGPSFATGSFGHSVHTWRPVAALGSRGVGRPRHGRARRGRAQSVGGANLKNQFWRFRGPRAYVHPSDMPGGREMVWPGFRNGWCADSVSTTSAGAALDSRWWGVGGTASTVGKSVKRARCRCQNGQISSMFWWPNRVFFWLHGLVL